MTHLIVFSLLIFSFGAHAKGEKFASNKSKWISQLDKRIAILQKKKACYSSAQDHKALKACRESSKGQMAALKSENESMRSQAKAENKAAIQKRIQELQSKLNKMN